MTNTYGWVLVVDVTRRPDPRVVSMIRLPSEEGATTSAANVEIDRENRRLLVSAYDHGLYVVDFNGPLGVKEIDVTQAEIVDEDGDGRDDRVLERIEVIGEAGEALNVINPVLLWEELGLGWVGGVQDPDAPTQQAMRGLSYAPPEFRVLAVDDGPLRQVDRLAPFGVPAADELPGLIRVEASLPSALANAAGEVMVDLVALGPGGLEIRGAGDPSLIENLPPTSFTGSEGLVLTRLTGKPWEEGYNVFSSEPIVVLADLRASHYYPLSDEEKARSENEGTLCSRCDLVAEGVYPANPTELYREILSGHQLGVRLPALLRTGLAELYDGLMLEQAEIEVASVSWDTSPALRQEPTRNPWYGTGDVAPGTLLHSGEMSHEVTDLVIPGRGFDFVFTRTYRSQTVGNGPLGPGWDHGYRMRLRPLPNGDVELFDGRGRRELFRRQANGTYKVPAGRFVSLERVASGWVMVDAGRNLIYFDPQGRLTSIADALKRSDETGNEMRFTYDVRDRLVRVNDTLDRDIHLEYDDQGRLERIRDFTGRVFEYAYDSSGRLEEFRTPQVTTSESPGSPASLVTRYSYVEATGDLAQVLNGRDNLDSFTDPKDQTWLALTYDDKDNDGRRDEVTTQTWGSGTLSIEYDFAGQITRVTDRRQNLWQYKLDDAGRCTYFDTPAGAAWSMYYNDDGLLTSRTEPLGRKTTLTYASDDPKRRSQGNLLEVRITPGQGGANGSSEELVTTFAYETETNQPTRIVDPLGAETVIKRNDVGLAERTTRAAGADESSATEYSYNAYGQPIEVVDPRLHRTTYEYFEDDESAGSSGCATTGSAGTLRGVLVDPGGLDIRTCYETDARGNVTTVVDPRGARHERDYNALDQLTDLREATTGTSDGAPALGYTHRYLHDGNGNLAEAKTPFGDGDQTTTVRYGYGLLDELLEVKRQILPGDDETQWLVETRQYDDNLNLELITDPEGNITEIDYDDRNLPEEIRSGLGANALPEVIIETPSFDLEGRLTSWKNARNKTWSRSYDGYGRLRESRDPLDNYTTFRYYDQEKTVRVERFDGTDELLAREDTVYDLLARAVERREWLFDEEPLATRELIWTTTYDAASNVEAWRNPLGLGSDFKYDASNRLFMTTDAGGNVQVLTPDATGNVKQVVSTELEPGGGSVTVTTDFTYDALNRRLTRADAFGNQYLRTYDARSNVVSVEDPEGNVSEALFDGLDRPTWKSRPGGITETFVWDGNSQLVSYADAEGHTTVWEYDAVARLERLTLPGFPEDAVYLYEYDKAHNPELITDPNGTVVDQEYDGANRLMTRTVTPDSNVEGVTAESFGYDGLNRLTSLTSGSVTTSLQWDSLSRLLSEETLGKAVGYEYDDAGNLGELTYPSGLVVARGHDHLNRPLEIGPWMIGEGGEPEIDAQVAYGYRGPSLVHEKILGNGLGGLWEYDQARRPINIEMDAGPAWEVYQETLSWSPRGLKVATTRGDDNGRGWLLGHDGAERLLHAVDELNATSAVGNNQIPDLGQLAGKPDRFSFTYDPVNNLTSRQIVADGETEELKNLPPDASGRNRPGQMGDIVLKYDDNGNLIEKGDFRFYYDFRNRLTRVTDAGSGTEVEVASYVYDGFNRRIGKTVAGGPAEETVWSGWRELEEYRDGTFFSRHTFGLGLDEIVKMEIDSDLDGTTDTDLYPIYDSTGNLIVLTDEQAGVVAQYTYAPFGRGLESYVDPDPPVIHHLSIEGGTIWIESSEELRWNNLEEGLSAGDIELSVPVPPLSAPGTATSKAALRKTIIPITVHQPIQDGRQARRRVIITATDPPLPGTEVRLTLRPPAVRDLSLNELAEAFQQTFTWPEEGAARAILVDETPPAVDEVVLRDGHLEVTLSEEPDMALVGSAFLVDGGAISWTLKDDTYTVRSAVPLAVGEHTLGIAAGTPFDLAGKGLEDLYETQVSVEDGTDSTEIYYRPDPRSVALGSLVNCFTFHGRPFDEETGLYYFRNRYFDPELGRFVTADPLGYVDGPSTYQFAGYTPYDYSDPMGLCNGCGWLMRFLHWTQKPARERVEFYQFTTQKRLEFKKIFNEWPTSETPIAFGPGWMLLGDERIVDSSGRILPDHVDAAVAMTIVGGVQTGLAAGAAGASSRQQFLVGIESILDDAAGEIIGVNPSVGRTLLSGRMFPEDFGGTASPGPLKNASGNLDEAAFAARTQPHYQTGIEVDLGNVSQATGRVDDLLESVDDVLARPGLLRDLEPSDLLARIRDVPEGWRVEALGRGSRKGQGFVLREYTPAGEPTGRMIRWHPGGGHHGPEPYWRVTNYNVKSGIIR